MLDFKNTYHMTYTSMMPYFRPGRIAAGIVAALCLLVAAGQPANAQTLARMDGAEITAAEFTKMYTRTHQEPPKLIYDAKEFLNRLIDFKVKLREAREQGLPNDPAIVKEISNYRDDLAASYLTEQKLVIPGARRYFDLRKEELMLSHIFFRVNKMQDGQYDTTEAYERGMEILSRVQKSKLPFDSLVMLYSDDDSKQSTRGNLGWWIAGSSYPTIDDAAYAMQEGEISKHLVRSPFGYHILKVTRRRPALVRVRGSHILYRLDLSNPLDTAAAYARLALVKDSLDRGLATFEELAKRNSQDPISGMEGGDLGWMDRGSLEETFERVLFDLKVGEVSGVTRTQFGMHLIKKTQNDEAPAFETLLPSLKKTYMDERFTDEYVQWMQDLLKKYRFTPHQKIEDLIISRLKKGTTTSTPDWWKQIPYEDYKAYLFKLGDEPFTVGEAIERIKVDPALQMRRFTLNGIDSISVLLGQYAALKKEAANLESEYPAFAALLEEYRQGVYVTALEQRAVSDVSITDEEVKAYWEKHRDEFRFPNRVAFSEILGYGEKFMVNILDSIKAGKSFDEMQARHSRRTGIGVKGGEWPLAAVNRNELYERAWSGNVGDLSEVFQTEKGYSVIRVNAKEPARVKTFEEAELEARAKLKQEKLDEAKKEWVKGLRQKYHVEVLESNLEDVLAKNTGK